MLPRVYPILDTASLDRFGMDPILCAAAFLEGGARILQFRHKAFWSRDTAAQAERIAALCREAGALFAVNDRADYAAILGAALHVGQDDLTPAGARKVIGSSLILGLSTHNISQMTTAQDEPVDYVAFGPVFPTVSKERPDPIVGAGALKAIRAITPKPLVAIGGITRRTAAECWRAGADSVAVISDLLPSEKSHRALRDRMMEWLRLGQEHR